MAQISGGAISCETFTTLGRRWRPSDADKFMDDILETLERQIALGPQKVPVDPAEAVDAARSSPLGRLMVALTTDQAVRAEWARATEFEQLDSLGRIGWIQADLEAVDETIDQQLESANRDRMIGLLARSGVGWRHDALLEALEDEGRVRREAAQVVARSTPDELRSLLVDCEVVDDVIALMRAGAVERADELWDQFLIWRGRVADLEEVDDETRESYLAQLDGIGACLEPTLYARGLLMGDYGLEWLGHRESVADFLQTYGPTDWLEVLGMLEEVDSPSAERLTSTLAVAAAAGLESESPDEDEAEQLLELLGAQPGDDQKNSEWETLATDLGFGFQIAMGEEDFALLLAQAAAHERLVTHGIHSPGIPGLPLSATTDEDVDLDQVTAVLEGMVAGDWNDEQEVRAVRTLCDARVWHRRDETNEEIARTVGSMFEQTARETLETPRAQLMAALDEARLEWERSEFDESPTLQGAFVLGASDDEPGSETLVDMLAERAADGETPLAMDCLRYLGRMPSDGALKRLAEAWTGEVPAVRAPFARAVLEEAVAVRVERRD